MASHKSYTSEEDKQAWNHPDNSSSNDCFDCNICLDSSHDPVVTLCGHLYCWPCIYKWLRVSFGSKCPVCKAHISTESIVPLYGNGTDSKKCQLDLNVPRRPSALLPKSPTFQHLPASLCSPTIKMVGEFLFGCMFGSSNSNVFGYPVSSYHHSTRLRRQEMRVDKSLNRVSIFLFCSLVLCLVLF